MLSDDVRETPDAVGLVGFVFDKKAGTRLLERQPGSSPHQHFFTKLVVELCQSSSGIECESLLQRRRPAHERAEVAVARQVVVDPPAFVAQRLRARQIDRGVHGGDVGAVGEVGHVQARTGQPFVEKPRAAGVLARWFLSAPGGDGLGTGGGKQPGEELQVQFLVLQAEPEVACKAVLRAVARGVLVMVQFGRELAETGRANARHHPQGLCKAKSVRRFQRLETHMHVT